MALYIVYKNAKKTGLEEPKLQELTDHVIDVVKISTLVCPTELNQVVVQPITAIETGNKDKVNVVEKENAKEKTEETKQAKKDGSA